jgi:hypothetical protein
MRRAALSAASLLSALCLGSTVAGTASPERGAPERAGLPGRTATPVAQGQALRRALEAIDACIASLDAEVDVGFRRIAARCPQLAPALQSGGFDRWLPRDWRDPENDLSSGGLLELKELLARELTLSPVRGAPSVARLRAALAALGAPPPVRSGIWARLASWLRRVAGPPAEPRVSSGLARMLRRIDLAPLTRRLVAAAALGTLVALAVLIVVNELRMTRVRRGPARARGERPARREASDVAGSPDLDAVEPVERPRLLLGWVLDSLSRARGLTGLRALTARELIGAVPLEDREAARELAQLALTAERVRYAPTPASPREIAAAVQDARMLLERLEARA